MKDNIYFLDICLCSTYNIDICFKGGYVGPRIQSLIYGTVNTLAALGAVVIVLSDLDFTLGTRIAFLVIGCMCAAFAFISWEKVDFYSKFHKPTEYEESVVHSLHCKKCGTPLMAHEEGYDSKTGLPRVVSYRCEKLRSGHTGYPTPYYVLFPEGRQVEGDISIYLTDPNDPGEAPTQETE